MADIVVKHYTREKDNAARVQVWCSAEVFAEIAEALPASSNARKMLEKGIVAERKRVNAPARDAQVAPIAQAQAPAKPASRPVPRKVNGVGAREAWAVAKEQGATKLTAEHWAEARSRAENPQVTKGKAKGKAKVSAASAPRASVSASVPTLPEGDALDALIRRIVAETRDA